MLDPGHGGVDGGAHGVGGAVEKTLVFEFCLELKRQLEATGRYTVVMTRDGDQYVDLDDRVTMARDANAALFISVHADTLQRVADVSGSTVYTVAERASDAEAARIAARENAADRTPGKAKKAQDDPGVADILFDLKRRETRAYAHLFSRGLVERPARRDPAQSQSGALGGLRRPEGAGISLGAGRTRLSLQRPGRRRRCSRRNGGRKPPRRWSRRSTPSSPARRDRRRAAAEPGVALSARPGVDARRIERLPTRCRFTLSLTRAGRASAASPPS